MQRNKHAKNSLMQIKDSGENNNNEMYNKNQKCCLAIQL